MSATIAGDDENSEAQVALLAVSDRKIPKVSGQAEGYPAELAELAEPGYVARVCISKAMLRVGE